MQPMHDFVARKSWIKCRAKIYAPASFPLRKKSRGWARSTPLTQIVLKFAGPGVADLYQGTEIWDDSLVDPDNRRPVDYDLRRKMLCGLKGREGRRFDAMLAGWAN